MMKKLRFWLGRQSEQWVYLLNHPAFQKSPVIVFLRLLVWRIRCWLGNSVVIWLPLWHIKMHLPALWRGGAKLLFMFREETDPEMRYLMNSLKPGNVIIDIGAALGQYTLCTAKLVGDSGKVFSFEPTSHSFKTLLHNLELNNVHNVHAFHLALTDQEGTVRLHHNSDPSRNSIGAIEDTPMTYEEVTTCTLDKILIEHAIDRIDFIKLDVEGAEELVLRGAEQHLERWRPQVLFEMNGKGTGPLGLSSDGVWKLFSNLGYGFFSVQEGGQLAPIYSPPGSVGNVTNVLAIYSNDLPIFN